MAINQKIDKAVTTKIKPMTKINIVIGMISVLFLGATIFNAAFLTTPISVSVAQNQQEDMIAPYVVINSLTNNEAVTGEIAISAFAYDDQKLKRVDFYIDNLLKKTDQNENDNWTMTWDTTTHPNGKYVLKAVAYDTAGNYHESQPITINIKN